MKIGIIQLDETTGQEETKHGCDLVGGESEIIKFHQLLEKKDLQEYGMLIFPTGFTTTDPLVTARLRSMMFKVKLQEMLMKFVNQKKIILGIGSGFHLLIYLGLLPYPSLDQQISVLSNKNGSCKSTWVYLKVNTKSPCIFTKGFQGMYLPFRQEYSQLYIPTPVMEELKKNNQIVLQYSNENFEPSQEERYNPSGTKEAIAGMCDPSGRIFGMMGHPESYLHLFNHPLFTKHKLNGSLSRDWISFQLFKNAVDYVAKMES